MNIVLSMLCPGALGRERNRFFRVIGRLRAKSLVSSLSMGLDWLYHKDVRAFLVTYFLNGRYFFTKSEAIVPRVGSRPYEKRRLKRDITPRLRYVPKKGNEGVLRMNFRHLATAKTMVDQKSLAL